jgi:ribonuclease E
VSAEAGGDGAHEATLESAGAEAGPVLAAEGRPVPAAEGHEASDGSEAPDAQEAMSGSDAHPAQPEPQPLAAEGTAGAPVSEPHQQSGGVESGAEPRHASSAAGPATYEAGPARYVEPEASAPHAQSAPAGDPSPTEPAHADPVPDDATRPARKGWWQRRLSGG